MKLKLLLFALVIVPNLFGSTIAVKGLFNLNMHLKYETSDNSSIFDDYGQNQHIPGIGQFFENGYFFGANISYRSKLKKSSFYLQFGIGYSLHQIESKFEDVDYIFGEKIDIQKIDAGVGLGKYFYSKNLPIYLYGFLGPVLNIYEGNTEFENINYRISYKNTVSYMLGLGAEFQVIPSLFAINIQVKLDLANIKRGNLKIYENDEWVITAKPVGESHINDDIFSISFGFTFLQRIGVL